MTIIFCGKLFFGNRSSLVAAAAIPFVFFCVYPNLAPCSLRGVNQSGDPQKTDKTASRLPGGRFVFGPLRPRDQPVVGAVQAVIRATRWARTPAPDAIRLGVVRVERALERLIRFDGGVTGDGHGHFSVSILLKGYEVHLSQHG
jgi:hypothetical protein